MKIKKYAIGLLSFSLVCFILYSCTKDSAAGAGDMSTGKGGSLTRFTIAGNYLYAVDNHTLYAYTLANPQTPVRVSGSSLNFDIETIYAYRNNLFLGTKTGLYIYSIDKPAEPVLVGQASHARACDPVVANDSVAFVTLKGWGNCGPATSGLYVHDVKDLTKPVLKTTIELMDPVGLGLQDSVLYVCCGNAGLKVFNVAKPYAPALLSTKMDGDYVDVVPYNGTLVCFVQNGIVLYDITKPADPVLIRTITN